MKKSKDILMEQPNIVDDCYIGGAHIQAADNYYRDKTSEDIQKILDRLTEIAVDSLSRQKQSELT